MLEVINSYLHGFAAIPVLAVCRDVGILAALEAGPVDVEQVAERLSANPGYCRVFFRALHSLAIVDSTDFRHYTLTDRHPAFALIPADADQLYHLDYAAFLWNGDDAGQVQRWLRLSAQGWNGTDGVLSTMLDGAILVPLLLELARQNPDHQGGDLEKQLFDRLHATARPLVRDFLRNKGLILPGESFALSDEGRYLCERALTMAVSASYRPLLTGLRELLAGDPRTVFAADAEGHEQHIDRTLNVVGSGFQHDLFFRDMVDLVVRLFDRTPLDEQPRCIVDMGCGDGTLLRTLHAAIAERSLRGRHLDTHPLLMVGADFNVKALEASACTLRDVPYRLLHGDISQPKRLLDDLLTLGIVTSRDDILHVRSFLDHDRPLNLSGTARTDHHDDHVYVDAAGQALASAAVRDDLQTHLQGWSEVIGRHGLVVLEVFALPVALTREYFRETVSFTFDLLHALSKQALVEAATFQQALASAGLFAEHDSLVRYPKTTPFSRIVLQHVKRKAFAIRTVRSDDIAVLTAIDRAAWPENLWLTETEIRGRCARYPAGQFAIECDGTVVGVLYTQRFDDLDALLRLRLIDYGRAHDDQGCYVLLLGVSVHPAYQSLALGDRLLEFALDLAVLTSGVKAAYGVTRCLDYAGRAEPLAAYITLQDAHGHCQDSLLRFHQAHGAVIECVVPGARPEDTDNSGAGVLIRYDLFDRLTDSQAAASKNPTRDFTGNVAEVVGQVVRRVMKHPENFVADLAFKELGLDSLSLMELRLGLVKQFTLPFEPAFFFSYPTANAVAGFIESRRSGRDRSADNPVAHRLGDCEFGTDDAASVSMSGDSGSQGIRADVAIVGMALRFAGAVDSPEAFWHMLADERCVISRRPDERWREYRDELDELPAELDAIHLGGFIAGLDQFDAAFFRITPVEARALDPQQRVLLELTWEAVEDAGIDPAHLAGRSVGTFLGAYTHDYELLTLRDRRLRDIDAYLGTGNALSTAAGRLAYFFDFRGPTVTIDTACSSSSSALFAACQSLKDGSSDVAVAAAVNLLLSPALSIAFTKAGMLSPDGLCKTFDNEANGYVRGEGAAVLVLKRLEEAVRDGDHVYGVIRSVALMQDGRTNGLTAPNGQAQADLIRRALALAQVSTSAVSYVEAHGTGTYLGDPVEMQALRAVYCDGVDRTQPLLVGSVKTNLGHTEAASGMAGLVKVLMAMRHKTIPAHLHLRQINRLLNIESGAIEVPAGARAWASANQQPRLAAVSSFGFSGTISHLIVEEFVPSAQSSVSRQPPWPAVVSAKSPEALRRQIRSWSDYLARADHSLDPATLSRALTVGRGQHAHRIAFSFGSLDELRTTLAQSPEPVAIEHNADQIAFLFTGQGSQYHGMARSLAQSSPMFRAELERCRTLMHACCETDLFEMLWGADATQIDQTRHTQVALFCIQHSLARLLARAGIRAGIALGHSVGEFAAACYAGAIDLASTIRLLCVRGELMQSRTREGRMAAVLAPIELVEKWLAGYSQVSIAALNGPRNQVISGDPAELAEIVRRAEAEGIPVFMLPVNRAFHSPLMATMLEPFFAVARQLDYAEPRIALISNVTGSLSHDSLNAEYWTNHISAPVHFGRSVATLIEQGVGTVIEIGPKPVLTNLARAAVPGARVQWLPSLLTPDTDALASIFTRASQANVAVDWRCYPHDRAHVPTGLPRYPFERRSYWLDRPVRAGESVAAAGAKYESAARNVADPSAGVHFHYRLHPIDDAPLHAHRVAGRAIFPASGYVSAMLEAALKLRKRSADIALTSMEFRQMLFVDPTLAHQLELQAGANRGIPTSIEMRARLDAQIEWQSCAFGMIEDGNLDATPVDPIDTGMLSTRLSGTQFYKRLQAFGYDYHAPFCEVTAVSYSSTHCVADIRAAETIADERFAIAPWTLDCCFQAALGALLLDEQRVPDRLLMPVSLARLVYFRAVSGLLRVHCRYEETGEGIDATLRIEDQHGRACCLVQGLRLRYLHRRSLTLQFEPQFTAAPMPVYAPRWEPLAEPVTWNAASVRRWLVFADEFGYGDDIARVIAEQGGTAQVVRLSDVVARGAPTARTLAGLIGKFFDASPGVAGLVYCWPVDCHANVDAGLTTTRWALQLLRALSTVPAGKLARAILLTRQTQAVTPGERRLRYDSASLWGLAGTFAAEVPTHSLTLVDVADSEDASVADRQRQASQILQVQLSAPHAVASGRFDQLALRDGQVFICRLEVVEPATAVPIDAQGCYLISGGLGGLGRLCAEYLHSHGAGRIVVLSRTADSEPAPWVQALNRQRDCIVMARCDVTDVEQVRALMAPIGNTLPLKGIVHAAGIVDDALLGEMTDARLDTVYTTKVHGARHLMDNLPLQQTDFIWLFSSVVGLFGGAGQANYAAANSALDGYARHLRAAGHPCVSVNWGAWKATGMMARVANVQAIQRRQFSALLDPDESGSFFDILRAAPSAQLCIARWRADLLDDAAVLPSMLTALRSQPDAGAAPSRERFLRAFEGAFGPERLRRMRAYIAATIAQISGIDQRTVLDVKTLGELGLDSLMYLSLRNALAASIDSPLEATLAFDYPTLDALAAALLQRAGMNAAGASVGALVARMDVAGSTMSDDDLDEIEALQDEALRALLGEEFARD